MFVRMGGCVLVWVRVGVSVGACGLVFGSFVGKLWRIRGGIGRELVSNQLGNREEFALDL